MTAKGTLQAVRTPWQAAALLVSLCLPATLANSQTPTVSPLESNNNWTGEQNFRVENKIRKADQFPGADAGAKIAAAIADLPPSGGTVSACGFEGAQTIASTIAVTRPVEIIFCPNATFTFTGSDAVITTTQKLHIRGGGKDGTVFNIPASASFLRSGNTRKAVLFGTVQDIKINFTGDNAVGVDACGLSRWDFNRVRVTRSGGTTGQVGMRFRCGDTVSSYSNNVFQCDFQGIQGKAIEITDAANDTRISFSNFLTVGGKTGIEVDGTGGRAPDAIWITNNRFDSNHALAKPLDLAPTATVEGVTVAFNRFETTSSTTHITIGPTAESTRLLFNWGTGGTFRSDSGKSTYIIEPRPFAGAPSRVFDLVWPQDLQLKNAADSPAVLTLDSGSTAEQANRIYFADRGANSWVIQKTAGGFFQVLDAEDSNRLRFALTRRSASDLNSAGVSPVRLNVTSGAGAGGTLFGDGQGEAVASVSSAGVGTFNGGAKLSPSGATITAHFSGTASLDFDLSEAGITCQDLTMPVAGASEGNTVSLGIPGALASEAGVVFSGWVSSPSTVTVRACDVTSSNPNPSAATIRADMWQH